MSLIETYAENPLLDSRVTATRIICTIGPVTNDVQVIKQLLRNGMSIARLNISHGTHQFHHNAIRNIREASAEVGKICAIMGDTKGPEIRTGRLKNAEVRLTAGNKFTFTIEKNIIGDETITSVSYKHLPRDLNVGDTIFVDEGILIFRVEEKTDKEVHTVVLYSGILGENKDLSVPGLKKDLPSLSDADKEDIAFFVENDVDILALSFINHAQDITEVRNLPGVKEKNIKIVAKIETRLAVDNFAEILEVSEGIMIARGDLGIDNPIETIPNIQKKLIKECNITGKPVIAAAQMLESMVYNPRPTRAEVSDVANAIFDGVDCIMLSGETARGRYPVECVTMMRKVCRETEKLLSYRNIYTSLRKMIHQMKEWSQETSITDSIASSAVKTCWDMNAAILISLTSSGQSARAVAKYRPHAPILCVTQNPVVARQSLLSRGIIPYIVDVPGNTEQINKAIEWSKLRSLIKKGEVVVITAGDIEGVSGSTNYLKVEYVL